MQDINHKAQYAYTAARCEAIILVGRILDQVNDLPAPDKETNWGHVGDLQSLIGDLRRALNIGEEED